MRSPRTSTTITASTTTSNRIASGRRISAEVSLRLGAKRRNRFGIQEQHRHQHRQRNADQHDNDLAYKRQNDPPQMRSTCVADDAQGQIVEGGNVAAERIDFVDEVIEDLRRRLSARTR